MYALANPKKGVGRNGIARITSGRNRLCKPGGLHIEIGIRWPFEDMDASPINGMPSIGRPSRLQTRVLDDSNGAPKRTKGTVSVISTNCPPEALSNRHKVNKQELEQEGANRPPEVLFSLLGGFGGEESKIVRESWDWQKGRVRRRDNSGRWVRMNMLMSGMDRSRERDGWEGNGLGQGCGSRTEARKQFELGRGTQ